ncbi:J domain-containing protein required for chloroplast accumulation response 1 isoform X4 [Gossypium raimondii]|uniref:J domain-containing protein required for chloroplast accumulation response 1 isoform X1 n=1 Tax=Gossypium raimondii TaxID=29730 RepID=UPI00063AD936|nr:J domain-containing protein required for chloroplast accumulation response 1 isoform X1 [Gossypium raimondii]XP_052488857.1 J domain-containing protein required for chloroplast accumulation response 1 isoform X2 [Gossypium raimondii]XP_052488858.1 J domain-containing protein required for chloroplast accumulation response 1 isoform X3 [Gossypium raimondii]XP_052488859.1 J domain-containing protein required for chloroplast accumulation response 1 isoform X4 [Gossypium raimondii]
MQGFSHKEQNGVALSSDIDFNDVFGGPPKRRSSMHETRRRFSENRDSSSSSSSSFGSSDEISFSASSKNPWLSGSSEKPVFGGEEGMNQRRHSNADFFNDIFGGNNDRCLSSSPRKYEMKDPFAPPSMAEPFATSLPSRFSLLNKGIDLPTSASPQNKVKASNSLSYYATRHDHETKSNSIEDSNGSKISNNGDKLQRCSSLKGWVTCDSRSDNWFVSGDRTSVNAKSFRIDSRNGDGERVRSIKEDDRSLSRPQLKTLELLLHEDQQGNDEMNRYDGTKDISRKSSKKLYEILDVENINMEANITIVKGNDEMVKKFHDIPYDENIKKLNTTRSANSTNMEATTRVKVHHADEKNKKLHEILDDGNIKEPNTTKRANSNNIEAITTRAKGSPRNSWDNGKSKVRGKVTEFIKIFNQDASPKPENGPNHLQMNENEVKFRMPTLQEKKPFSQVAIADHMSEGEAQKNNNGSLIDHVSNGFNTVIEDPAKSSEDNFLIEDQTPEEKIFPDFGIDPEEIKAIDAKIQQWSNGKQGNIRSLLSTLQYVLWPNSGWKPVPLMDIIEGPAVKRSYQKALLCLHPDKLQQKGAASDQKYIAQIVFDFLQDAWAHSNSIGLM